ncbi:MAG: hypothetical protein ABSA08_08945 [Acidimicrobiales bacterium]
MPAERVAKADRGTVVIVKDDHHIADLVDLWLRNAGFRVLQAAEARRGIFAFQRRLADSGSSCLQGFPDPERHFCHTPVAQMTACYGLRASTPITEYSLIPSWLARRPEERRSAIRRLGPELPN